MNSTLAWLLVCLAAFASGAWWQRAGCEVRQLKAQERVLERDAEAVTKTVEPIKRKMEVEHERTVKIIETAPGDCLRESVPAAIADRLRQHPSSRPGPSPDG